MGKAWFEEASRPLDPGLVHQLRKRRKRGGDGRDEAIPVIIRFKREAEEVPGGSNLRGKGGFECRRGEGRKR